VPPVVVVEAIAQGELTTSGDSRPSRDHPEGVEAEVVRVGGFIRLPDMFINMRQRKKHGPHLFGNIRVPAEDSPLVLSLCKGNKTRR
jgi:hypothetical protein